MSRAVSLFFTAFVLLSGSATPSFGSIQLPAYDYNAGYARELRLVQVQRTEIVHGANVAAGREKLTRLRAQGFVCQNIGGSNFNCTRIMPLPAGKIVPVDIRAELEQRYAGKTMSMILRDSNDDRDSVVVTPKHELLLTTDAVQSEVSRGPDSGFTTYRVWMRIAPDHKAD